MTLHGSSSQEAALDNKHTRGYVGFFWFLPLVFLLIAFVCADWFVGPYLFPYPKKADFPNAPKDLVIPDRIEPPPREILLMGFYAPPGVTLSDVSINQFGFAGNAPPVEKLSGTKRILMLGGSAFFNRNIADRLSQSLNTLLSTQNSTAVVLGAALPRHTTRSSLLKFDALRRYGFDGKNSFDFVLIYHGINDLWSNNFPLEQFLDDYSHLDPWYHHNILLDHSLIFRKIYNSWIYPVRHSLQGDGGYPTREHENLSHFASEKTFEKNMQQLIDDVKQSGGTPILLTFAWHIPAQYKYELFEKNLLGYNNPENYNKTPVEMWGSADYVNEGIARHNAVTRRLALQNHVPLLDMENLIGDDISSFGDVCHLSDDGTRYMVDTLAAFLRNQVMQAD